MGQIEYIRPIDPHVHLRWEEYREEKPSYAHLAFRDAVAVGLQAMIEQPNTHPPLIDTSSIEKRISFIDGTRANVEGAMHVQHAISVAMTGEKDQITDAVAVIKKNPRVVSAKTFFVESTKSGAIEILNPITQAKSWAVLGMKIGEPIVREGHFENGALFTGRFDPTNPLSHSNRQGPDAEVDQVLRQLRYAHEGAFRGAFVVKHTSTADTITAAEDYITRCAPPFKVLFETTFHHMFLNTNDYERHGNGVKMNPPLRDQKTQESLLEAVLAGRTHTIGTDHAPHPYNEKIKEPWKSGIPEIPFWPKGIELLRRAGLKLSDETRLIYETANKTYFKGKLPRHSVKVEYDPSLWEAYGFNPFSRIDGT